jgi:transcriptional regulator with XRE-family HTH domain
VKMINRLTKAQHDPTLSTLDKIADACGIQAWQLLLEDFDPAHPPSATITDDERKMLSRLRRILDSE